jgi:hypothetical protein
MLSFPIAEVNCLLHFMRLHRQICIYDRQGLDDCAALWQSDSLTPFHDFVPLCRGC